MTKDEIKATLTMHDVLLRNGIKVNRNGFITCPFHTEKTASMKIFGDSFYCFACGAYGDIFDMEMQLNHCDFRTAYEILGGGEKPSWRAVVIANKAKRLREEADREATEEKLKIKTVALYITAYRKLIEISEPFSDIWCYCINKLQYQEYLLETYLELDK